MGIRGAKILDGSGDDLPIRPDVIFEMDKVGEEL